MLKKIIRRPVLATVISIILVILGLIGLSRLPLTQFPEIAPPSVQVNAFYPGGNAEVVSRSVIVPLEEPHHTETPTTTDTLLPQLATMVQHLFQFFLNWVQILIRLLSMCRIGLPRLQASCPLKWFRRVLLLSSN